MDAQLYSKLTRSCGDVEARIRACKSRAIAQMLKERLCHEFEAECESQIVRNFLYFYLDSLIEKTFDPDGTNKYLEDL